MEKFGDANLKVRSTGMEKSGDANLKVRSTGKRERPGREPEGSLYRETWEVRGR